MTSRPRPAPQFVIAALTVLLLACLWAAGPARADRVQDLVQDHRCRKECETSSDPCCLERCAYRRCIKENSGVTMQRGGIKKDSVTKAGPSVNIGLQGSGIEAIPACKPVEAVMKACFDRNWDKDAFCKNNAHEAKRDTEWARANHCGASGDIWVDDAKAYAERCKALHKPRETMAQEEAARDKVLDACRRRHQACRRYASLNVEQRRRNRVMRCEQSGEGWDAGQEEFFRACQKRGLGQAALEKAHAAREADLAQCQGQRMAEQRRLLKRCWAAARHALRHQAQNHALGCGFSGPLWINDRDAFFKACVKSRTQQERLRLQHQVRKARLEKCRQAQAAPPPPPKPQGPQLLAQGVRKFTGAELEERYRKNKHDWWTIPETITIPAPGVIAVDPGLEVTSTGIGCLYGGGVGVRKVGESVGQPPGQEFAAGSYRVDLEALYNSNIPAWCDQVFRYQVTYTPKEKPPAEEEIQKSTAQPSEQDQPATGFAGQWESNWGPMTLSQSGGRVTGSYSHDKGRIEGEVKEGVLTGAWSEAPSYAPPDDSGRIVFRLSADGESFSGTWGYGASSDDGSWEGRRK